MVSACQLLQGWEKLRALLSWWALFQWALMELDKELVLKDCIFFNGIIFSMIISLFLLPFLSPIIFFPYPIQIKTQQIYMEGCSISARSLLASIIHRINSFHENSKKALFFFLSYGNTTKQLAKLFYMEVANRNN